MVIKILQKHECAFSKYKGDIGCSKIVKHEICTVPRPPVHVPMRRIPMHLEEQVDQHVEDLLKQNIIRKSQSPWNAALVVVPKKDGTIRMCVDYRNLNALTIRPIYPIPDTKHLLDSLSGSAYFSSIDLSSAYYQCEMAEKDKPKTAFATRKGHFEFNRMPFGLSGAPATFQRLMNLMLEKENWEICLIYLDDVMIFGRTFEEHLQRVACVLKRVEDSGLKLSPMKCNFFAKNLQFLGHVVNSDGIKPDPKKVEKVKNWVKPQNIEDMRSFLGFSNYYRKFIKNYDQHTTPLEEMMKKRQYQRKQKILSYVDRRSRKII